MLLFIQKRKGKERRGTMPMSSVALYATKLPYNTPQHTIQFFSLKFSRYPSNITHKYIHTYIYPSLAPASTNPTNQTHQPTQPCPSTHNPNKHPSPNIPPPTSPAPAPVPVPAPSFTLNTNTNPPPPPPPLTAATRASHPSASRVPPCPSTTSRTVPRSGSWRR